jgi:transcriptional regulator with XRE-family HTH domain
LESSSIMTDRVRARRTTKRRTAKAPDINSRIAQRVHSLRRESSLSLEALAAKCSVSRSMLSLVERGESSPTAALLERIATGLGVPLAVLFEDPAVPAQPLSREADRTSWRDPASGYVRRNISPPNFASAIRIAEVTLPAGAHVAYENGVAGIHQQVWVQDGAIEVSVGRITYPLARGDCLAMRLDEPTAFRNRKRKAARYIVVLGTEPYGTLGR